MCSEDATGKNVDQDDPFTVVQRYRRPRPATESQGLAESCYTPRQGGNRPLEEAPVQGETPSSNED